jgi:mRNA-degrading endonuclease RelE of RelBE toxin-antitoxin system
MELKFSGQFKRDIANRNSELSTEIYDTILAVKKAYSVSQIPQIKKLRKYQTLYRIKVAGDYRIGVVVRNKTIWFVRFGHRSIFYKKLFP